MRKTMMFLLLAATAASPLLAQNVAPSPDDQHRDRRGDGERGPRGEQRGPQGDQRGPVAQSNQAPPQVQQQAQQPQGGRAMEQQRGPDASRGDYRAGGQDPRQFDRNRGPDRGPGAPGNYAQGQGGRDYRDDRRGPDGRGPDGRGPDGREWRGDRDGRGPDGRDFRGGPGGRDGRDYRGDDRGRNDGRWNNSWRSDRRYDWQGYRSQNRGIYRLPRYYAPRGYASTYRRWSPGYRLDPFFFAQSYWISDPWEYRLPPAYGPYRWVRYYNDVLLVDIRTGQIADVIYSFFY